MLLAGAVLKAFQRLAGAVFVDFHFIGLDVFDFPLVLVAHHEIQQDFPRRMIRSPHFGTVTRCSTFSAAN